MGIAADITGYLKTSLCISMSQSSDNINGFPAWYIAFYSEIRNSRPELVDLTDLEIDWVLQCEYEFESDPEADPEIKAAEQSKRERRALIRDDLEDSYTLRLALEAEKIKPPTKPIPFIASQKQNKIFEFFGVKFGVLFSIVIIVVWLFIAPRLEKNTSPVPPEVYKMTDYDSLGYYEKQIDSLGLIDSCPVDVQNYYRLRESVFDGQ